MNEILGKNEDDCDKFLEENKIIFKKYKPIKKLDNGAFGNIYSIIDIKNNNLFAMKIENKNFYPKTLESEAYYLFNLQGGIGIPKLISFGYNKKYNILIEELLGKSLFSLFIENSKKCNIEDVCLIAHQILDRLDWIHSKYIIYRDIKPENFLIGRKDSKIIYIVDFGLCKKYRSSKTGKHITAKNTRKFNGTFLYSSPNAIKGKEMSRRDDLISLGYMLIFLLKRNLPWMFNFGNINKENYNKLIYLKETNGYNKLFDNIPKEFKEYINYSRNLNFEETPNYLYLHSLFNKILFKLNINYNKINFSWINSRNKQINYFLKRKSQNSSLKKVKKEKAKKFNMIMNRNYNLPNNITQKSELSINRISSKVYLKNNNNINNINSEINLNNSKIIWKKRLKKKDINFIRKGSKLNLNVDDNFLNSTSIDKINNNNNSIIKKNSIFKRFHSNFIETKNLIILKNKYKLSFNTIYKRPLSVRKNIFKNDLINSYNLEQNFPFYHKFINLNFNENLNINRLSSTFESIKNANNNINNIIS